MEKSARRVSEGVMIERSVLGRMLRRRLSAASAACWLARAFIAPPRGRAVVSTLDWRRQREHV